MKRKLSDEQRAKKNEDAKKYYAKYRERIRAKYSSDDMKVHRRTVAEARRRTLGVKPRDEWTKAVSVSDAVKKERKAAYERLRYLKNRDDILRKQKEYYHQTNDVEGVLSHTEILERHRLREIERRRKLGVKPRNKISDDERRARKRKYMQEYLKRKS